MQKDALQKDYSNIKYEQPYQTAMYNQSVLSEAKRWHVHSYEEVIPDLIPQDLQVTPQHCPSNAPLLLIRYNSAALQTQHCCPFAITVLFFKHSRAAC